MIPYCLKNLKIKFYVNNVAEDNGPCVRRVTAYQINSYLLQTFRYRAHAWIENCLETFDYSLWFFHKGLENNEFGLHKYCLQECF